MCTRCRCPRSDISVSTATRVLVLVLDSRSRRRHLVEIAPTLTLTVGSSGTLSPSASGRDIAHTVVSDSGDVSVSIATELSTSTAARHCSHAHGRLRHTLSTSASLAETLLSQSQ
eukprot:scaffold14778_cov151-Skeletonema_dohrnii-CCMP3373.AAC.5